MSSSLCLCVVSALVTVCGGDVFRSGDDEINSLNTIIKQHQRGSNRPHRHEDPEVHMNPRQLVTSKGFPVEEYEVQTEDGFLLTVLRIPRGRKQSPGPRPVVYLQHCLLGSAADFLTMTVNESLGFILADAGFDVWLGNARGNSYSMKHTVYSTDQPEFWAWSWDEMAKYDLPATINFCLKESGQDSLYYIGFSQGTIQGFAAFSQNQELAKKVKIFFAMAPITTLGHMISPIKYLADLSDKIIFDVLGRKDILEHDGLLTFLSRHVICNNPLGYLVCENVFFLTTGYDLSRINQTRLPVILAFAIAGTSVQNIVHYAQMIRSNVFRMYDYQSAAENMRHYNQTTPPTYDVTNIRVPVVLLWGANDWLADPIDVAALAIKLKNSLLKSVGIPGKWNHPDFLFGIDAKKKVYDEIISLMHQYP